MDARRLLILTVGILALAAPAGFAEAPNEQSDVPLRQAIALLKRVPQGRTLLARAENFWNFESPEGLLRYLRWGAESKTDAVLTRHYNTKTGEEKREREVSIVLRDDLKLEELVLDISHELVHATTHVTWDPYDPRLTAGRYVWSAIEGEGGEVQAVQAECQVALELSHISNMQATLPRCLRYLKKHVNSANAKVDRRLVAKDFYASGKWARGVRSRLGDEAKMFPLLSSRTPQLYSSTGHAPYPVALLDEYTELNEVACRNSRKRGLASQDSPEHELLVKRCGQKPISLTQNE